MSVRFVAVRAPLPGRRCRRQRYVKAIGFVAVRHTAGSR